MHWLPEDSPALQVYKEVTEKPSKKIKSGQKLTRHQVITRNLITIYIDLQKTIKRQSLYNQEVDRVMAKAVVDPHAAMRCDD